jgi:hypothetical protein
VFDTAIDYPIAIASYDDHGVQAAIDWSCQHLEDDDVLKVWTYSKGNLRNCSTLDQLVARHSNVEHVTGRGGGYVRGTGPVLMAWADMGDIGELLRSCNREIRSLCVISFDDDALRPWVAEVRPTIPWRQLPMAIRDRRVGPSGG